MASSHMGRRRTMWIRDSERRVGIYEDRGFKHMLCADVDDNVLVVYSGAYAHLGAAMLRKAVRNIEGWRMYIRRELQSSV